MKNKKKRRHYDGKWKILIAIINSYKARITVIFGRGLWYIKTTKKHTEPSIKEEE